MAVKKIKWFQQDGSLLHPETDISQIVDFPNLDDYVKKSGDTMSGTLYVGTDARKAAFGDEGVSLISEAGIGSVRQTTYGNYSIKHTEPLGTENEYTFPEKSGTFALEEDIPTIPNISVTNSGSGNAVTSITASGHRLTVTKGQTFALKSEIPDLTNYVTLNTTQYIEGFKEFLSEKLHVSKSDDDLQSGITFNWDSVKYDDGGSGIYTISFPRKSGTFALEEDIPKSLKNPYSLSITVNGTTTTYDGSSSRSVNITTSGGGQSYTAGTGISISSNVIATIAASTSSAGHVTTGVQTFAGRKTFNGGINISSGATIQLNGSSGTSGYVLTSGGSTSSPTWTAILGSYSSLYSLSSVSNGQKTISDVSGYRFLVFVATSTDNNETSVLSIPRALYSSFSTSEKIKINGTDPYTNRYIVFHRVSNTSLYIDSNENMKNFRIWGIK